MSGSKHLYNLNLYLRGLIRSDRFIDALELFAVTNSDAAPKPDHYTLSTTLTACAHAEDASFGSQLHARAVRTGLLSFRHVANTLLLLFSRTGEVGSADRLFWEIPSPDAYSWTTLLSACSKLSYVSYACRLLDSAPQGDVEIWNAVVTGCAKSGDEDVVFGLIRKMHRIGIGFDNYSLASVLSCCCCVGCFDFGRAVQCLVVKAGFSNCVSVVNALLSLHFESGNAGEACRVFDEAESRNQITYNTMIDGFVSLNMEGEALQLFRGMQEAGVYPTELTFVSLMGSCLSSLRAGQLHARALVQGLEPCTSVSNAAITMYSNCGDFNAAHRVFNRLGRKDLVSWNAMISAFSQSNGGASAMLLYKEMSKLGIQPDEFTFGSLLSCLEFSESVEIHGILHQAGLMVNIQVSNALASAYSKHGKMEEAYRVFLEMSSRNLISWNTVLSGFLLNGCPERGLLTVSDLVFSGLKPNSYTLSMALAICADACFLRHAKEVHGYIIRNGLSLETSLENGLITAYSKCGFLSSSLKVFKEIIERDIVSWNALISALSQHGRGEDAVECFKKMLKDIACQPDPATFTALLSACSHSGLVDDGTRIFNCMVHTYGLTPQEDHLSCMVDLYGRAGYLDEAKTIVNGSYAREPSSLWTLLSACATHGDSQLGRTVAQLLLQKEPNDPSIYVLLSNIYAVTDQWSEAANLRMLLEKTGAVKSPAHSWLCAQ
ncbi:hypothetical protein MLD38_030829 [Melastoma candidum]|uniref:Uncharacterized protein n=1 Tax=Melastoma candidum TaxID=119954 RepID=A0ACB9MRE3_9MYRT|nr:hypothetical protein MLD38_030829 [Melastoma candidum]